jgi:hypothetical protein
MNTEILCQKYPGDLTDEQIIKGWNQFKKSKRKP